MNIVQKILLYTLHMGLLITPSCTLPMTLEDLPQDIHELIVQKVIEQSDNAQQIRSTLAACAGISRRWNFLRADLQNLKRYSLAKDKTRLKPNYIARAVVEKANQDVKNIYTTALSTPKRVPGELPIGCFTGTGFSMDPENFPLGLFAKFMDGYVESKTISIDSIYMFFMDCKNNPVWQYYEQRHQGYLYSERGWFHQIKKLIITYLLDTDKEKQIRAKELLTIIHINNFLNSDPDYVHSPCPYSIRFESSMLNDSTIISFLYSSDCPQEKVVFLQKIFGHTLFGYTRKNLSIKPIVSVGVVCGMVGFCAMLCISHIYKGTHPLFTIRPLVSALTTGALFSTGAAIAAYRRSNYYKISKILRARGFKL